MTTRPARKRLWAAGVAAAVGTSVSACGSSPPPGPQTVMLPASTGAFAVRSGLSGGLIPGFGLARLITASPTSCRIAWYTTHPPGPSHQVTVAVGQTATLRAFRIAQVTLVTSGPGECDFKEFEPSYQARG